MIDEAQKVPEIFDALKFQVDQNRVPGKYVILGSTEFSSLTRVRESLTGRVGRIRLFPLTLVESLSGDSRGESVQQSDVVRYLDNTGQNRWVKQEFNHFCKLADR